VTLTLDRRVELIAGPMMSIMTTTIDMITRINNVRFAVRFPCSTPDSLRAVCSLGPARVWKA
jgi:hypothetical protein